MTPIFLAVGAGTVLAVGPWCWAESSLLLPSVALGLLTILRSSLASTRSSPVFEGAPTRMLKRHLCIRRYRVFSHRAAVVASPFLKSKTPRFRGVAFCLVCLSHRRRASTPWATRRSSASPCCRDRTAPCPRRATSPPACAPTARACSPRPPARPPREGAPRRARRASRQSVSQTKPSPGKRVSE